MAYTPQVFEISYLENGEVKDIDLALNLSHLNRYELFCHRAGNYPALNSGGTIGLVGASFYAMKDLNLFHGEMMTWIERVVQCKAKVAAEIAPDQAEHTESDFLAPAVTS